MTKRLTKEIIDGDHKGAFVFERDKSMTKTIEQLPGGIYTIGIIQLSMFERRMKCVPLERKEQYIDMTSGTVKKVLDKLENFFSDDIKQKYSELGILHKTGLVLYGIPGTGKTVTCQIIMDKLVTKYNALCFVLTSCAPDIWTDLLDELKQLGETRPIVFFVDECEENLSRFENEWLTFLDGHDSVSNFVFLGCTNYLNEISERLKRPSRIEHLVEVSSIEEEVAQTYVSSKLGKLDQNLRNGMVHYAMELKSTIDSFKNAIKEFYIYYPKGDAEDFKNILESYIRKEEEQRKVELAEREED